MTKPNNKTGNKNEVNISGYIYTVIRNDNDCGTDSVSLFHFTSRKDARKWIKKDIEHTFNDFGYTPEIDYSKDYWVYDNDTIVIDWSIRKLPLQTNGEWTDPNYTVKYVMINK